MEVSSATLQGPATLMQSNPETFIKLCLLWTAIHRTNVLPQACKNVIPSEDVEKLRSQINLNEVWGSLTTRQRSAYYRPSSRDIDHHDNHIQFHYRYTSKSLSILGILGGVVLILLVIAMSTCIRNRRRMLMEEQENHAHESFAREILISHMRQLRRGVDRNDVPPSYDDVVKPEEDIRQSNSSSTLTSSLNSSSSLSNPHAVAYELQDQQEPPSYIEALQVEAAAAAAASTSAGSDEHVVTIEVKGDDEDEKGHDAKDAKDVAVAAPANGAAANGAAANGAAAQAV